MSVIVLAGVSALTGCTSNPDPSKPTIVIGSQGYYSSEIIAEIYAQALEKAGYAVDRQFRIGPREVYLPEIEAGRIDLFPEYSGPLLQYWQPGTTARLGDDVYAQLQQATPPGLRVLDQSAATDQDSYVVTQAFANQWGLVAVSDLAKVTTPLILGASSNALDRPNGPNGLLSVYGIEVGFTPIEDSGGPLTVKALKDGDIQLAIIYTANPSITANNLITLEDNKGLFLASHIVPLASDNVDEQAASIINAVSAAMGPGDLIGMNARSVNDQLPAQTIARDWLTEKGLI
ncbi:MAG: ABC transporter substrate-binding protein [Propionibacteriaceae bacterium]|nr:ABC transporter substrate-binding protein [Propionibacteriaceae bacterium]